MTLTTAQQVRLRVQDIPAIADVTLAGDGTATQFYTPQRNLTSASAFVPLNNTSWTATGATFDASGSVAFSGVVSAGSAFRLRYVYSVFSDDEIDTMLTAGGGVVGAGLEAVQSLMFDGLKRARWTAPDGSGYDDTAAINLLKALYETLKSEQEDAATEMGGVASWGLEQGNY